LISDVATNLNSKRIVKSIINIIHELGMKVVAEYVEDKATYQVMILLGADYVQGHYIAEAMNLDFSALSPTSDPEEQCAI
jgi:EAL domain-containing protein (putative c-di-GMP-specific phosphodiesterase class I)